MVRKYCVTFWIFCVFLAGTNITHADEYTPKSVGMDSAYVTIFGGGVLPHDITHGYTHVNPAENGNSIHNLDTGYIVGASIGANVWQNLVAELELSHSVNSVSSLAFDNPIFIPFSGPATGHIKSTNLMVNFWHQFEDHGPITPYLGGGVGVAFLDAKSLLNNTPEDEFRDTKAAFAYQLGAGGKVALTERIDFDLGYRFRSVPNVTLASEITGQVNQSANINSHSVQFGVSFKLN